MRHASRPTSLLWIHLSVVSVSSVALLFLPSLGFRGFRGSIQSPDYAGANPGYDDWIHLSVLSVSSVALLNLLTRALRRLAANGLGTTGIDHGIVAGDHQGS